MREGRDPLPLESSEELFEHAPCGYLSTLPDGTIIRANQLLADWTGYTSEDIVGRRFQEFLTSGGRIYYDTHVRPLLDMQGKITEVALDLLCPGGRRMPTLLNASQSRDQAGVPKSHRYLIIEASDRRAYEREILGARREAEEASEALRRLNCELEERVAREVDERLRVEAALQHARKLEALGLLSGTVAHDFNNLLSIMVANLEAAQRRTRGEDAQRFIAAAMAGAEKGNALVSRMLGITKIHEHKPQTVDLAGALARVLPTLRDALTPETDLLLECPPSLPPVRVDLDAFERAMLNLAVNARHAMPSGGTLTISLREYTSSVYRAPALFPAVCVAVSDTGVGMDAATLARATEPLFTTKPAAIGTGLGLFMVQGFVVQSGGTLRLHSRPGEGTTVEIWLPTSME